MCDRRRLRDVRAPPLAAGMASNRGNARGLSVETKTTKTSKKKTLTGQPVWVSSEPSPDEVEELARRFPEVVDLLDEEVRGETDNWLAKGLVARSLGQKIAAKAAAHEFW